jgi:hypothetical protein
MATSSDKERDPSSGRATGTVNEGQGGRGRERPVSGRLDTGERLSPEASETRRRNERANLLRQRNRSRRLNRAG